jgi:hypothetical protein
MAHCSYAVAYGYCYLTASFVTGMAAPLENDFDRSVTNPPHYDIQVRGVECEVYDIQKAFLAHWKGDPYAGHCLATALKYLFRAGRKGGVATMDKDLGKLAQYVGWAIEANGKPLLQDIFPPVVDDVQAAGCEGGFCPMPVHSGDRGPRESQSVHPAVRSGLHDVVHDEDGYHRRSAQLPLQIELEFEGSEPD